MAKRKKVVKQKGSRKKPLKLAIYTLTRDRLPYTERCFRLLRGKAGYPFDWFVVDNGSRAETIKFLKTNRRWFKKIIFNPVNRGIPIASNQAIKAILNAGGYDVIAKFDNDCELLTKGGVAKIMRFFEQNREDLYPGFVISPLVEGIVHFPRIHEVMKLGRFVMLHTGHVGGLFRFVSADVFSKRRFRFDRNLPMAKGADGQLSAFANIYGYFVGYLLSVRVGHIDTTEGQAQRFPEYFKRKFEEEKIPYFEVAKARGHQRAKKPARRRQKSS